jgi:hypothetical protein
MPVFNIAQALLWICNHRERKFTGDKLEAQLAFLAAPPAVGGVRCPPSRFFVHQMFSKGTRLSRAYTPGDIQSAPRAISDEATRLPGNYPAPSVLQRAHDDLIEELRKGKIAISGRRVREPETVRLENGVLGSIEYLPGRGPAIDLEIIPPVAFAELQFVDRDDGIEAVPMDFQAHKFPRWRDLSVVADDVRRLWPAESHRPGVDETEADSWQPDKKTGRPKGTGYSALDAPLVTKIKKMVEVGKAKSHTEAARMLLGEDGTRVAGIGSLEAKISRLVKAAGVPRKTEKK